MPLRRARRRAICQGGGDVSRLAVARAAGVHAATAPIVVIGETDTYPDPHRPRR